MLQSAFSVCFCFNGWRYFADCESKQQKYQGYPWIGTSSSFQETFICKNWTAFILTISHFKGFMTLSFLAPWIVHSLLAPAVSWFLLLIQIQYFFSKNSCCLIVYIMFVIQVNHTRAFVFIWSALLFVCILLYLLQGQKKCTIL